MLGGGATKLKDQTQQEDPSTNSNGSEDSPTDTESLNFQDLLSKINDNVGTDTQWQNQLSPILQQGSSSQSRYTIISQDLESCKTSSSQQEDSFCYLELRDNTNSSYKLRIGPSNVISFKKDSNNAQIKHYRDQTWIHAESVNWENLTTYKDENKKNEWHRASSEI
ncbi:hypothetical protein [Candidatus Mycoplasma haematominutum]|uniref:Uncharacterized protein n=1 Tax=Candidatus Mycoplasma haematominutum 'Birmingham 1' TaxID=1116213 RepID=G8C2Q6_9MOLU|nr:hypothetical protein [Candidatus Mycoplasma haematominutum]CCE66604.1 hypothetical protein MHM_00860 [Candidatus Mycoplasma haematominutum 'Birmingham 1']